MLKARVLTVVLTLLLAVPLTALAVLLAGSLTDGWPFLVTSLLEFSRETSMSGQGWLRELALRWPEIAGMVAGQLLILIIFLLIPRKGQSEA